MTNAISHELFDFVCAQRDEYAEKLEAEKLDRLQSTQSMYVEQMRLSGEINTLIVNYKDLQAKYLELVAMISYYTEDNRSIPYCRDIRGEVAKAAQQALDALKEQTP